MENPAEKKKLILESTLELVKDFGFHGTPMSAVAKKAGVAAGTIYHYFDSKDTLICELFNYITGSIIRCVFSNDDESLPFKERFFRVWKGLFSFYRHNPSVLVFFEQFVNSPYNKYIEAAPQSIFTSLNAFFQQGITDGYLQPVAPEILTVLTHGSITSTAKVTIRGKIEIGEPELQQIIGILWQGMAIK
ncbi:TetR/AcrR family transcriptional regulator [Pontibacter ruber]|uniref:TetR/AcrR family transcriptional regulator n=1 Tax=Pontibacter ruber TaxID=1343895 RepID=A0ABW5CQX7_9BACT|nr:TetR/AcrR family transcriptional regulator [Pontibacter ruber]